MALDRREGGMGTHWEGEDNAREFTRGWRCPKRGVDTGRERGRCTVCVVFPVACLPADVKRKWRDQQGLLPTLSFTSCGNTCMHKHT